MRLVKGFVVIAITLPYHPAEIILSYHSPPVTRRHLSSQNGYPPPDACADITSGY
jgi:hypothetical protein